MCERILAILSNFERFLNSFEEVLEGKLGVRTAQEVLAQLVLTPARKEVLARSNTCPDLVLAQLF